MLYQQVILRQVIEEVRGTSLGESKPTTNGFDLRFDTPMNTYKPLQVTVFWSVISKSRFKSTSLLKQLQQLQFIAILFWALRGTFGVAVG